VVLLLLVIGSICSLLTCIDKGHISGLGYSCKISYSPPKQFGLQYLSNHFQKLTIELPVGSLFDIKHKLSTVMLIKTLRTINSFQQQTL